MSTATTTATPTLDVSGTSPVPFGRLVAVEVRKMADTRAGMWLLIAIGLITAAAVTIFYFAAPDGQRTFLNFMIATASPQGSLLPVLGILLVTSEWGQRTTLTTFALEPARLKVIWAKVIAALMVGLVAIVVAIAVGIVLGILGAVAGAANSGGLLMVVGILWVLFWAVFGLGMRVMIIMGLIKGFSGQYWKMPIIGNFAEKYS